MCSLFGDFAISSITSVFTIFEQSIKRALREVCALEVAAFHAAFSAIFASTTVTSCFDGASFPYLVTTSDTSISGSFVVSFSSSATFNGIFGAITFGEDTKGKEQRVLMEDGIKGF